MPKSRPKGGKGKGGGENWLSRTEKWLSDKIEQLHKAPEKTGSEQVIENEIAESATGDHPKQGSDKEGEEKRKETQVQETQEEQGREEEQPENDMKGLPEQEIRHLQEAMKQEMERKTEPSGKKRRKQKQGRRQRCSPKK